MDTGEKIKALRLQHNMTLEELGKRVGVGKSTVRKWETGAIANMGRDKIEKLSEVFGVSPTYLITKSSISPSIPKDFIQLFASPVPDNVVPMPRMRTVPLIGTIACGDPILAEENIEGEVAVPDHINADFALKCRGDSMINARVFGGDIVYIRQQETVNDGEIAAVLIGDDATLKRVHLYEDHIVLEPENPLYRPIVLWGNDMNTVRILGKAVAFTSIVR